MNVTIGQIIVNIETETGKQTISLTLDEAKQLHECLNDFFGPYVNIPSIQTDAVGETECKVTTTSFPANNWTISDFMPTKQVECVCCGKSENFNTNYSEKVENPYKYKYYIPENIQFSAFNQTISSLDDQNT